MYCCTQFFHSNFLVPHIPTIPYYTYDKCYVARRKMSISNNPSFFLNSFFIAPSKCAFQTYLMKNIYNISLSSGERLLVIPFFSLSGSMLSLFLSSVYERGHVNALSDNTHNILYYVDIELTKNTALECCFPSCTSYVCISNQLLERKFCPIHPQILNLL